MYSELIFSADNLCMDTFLRSYMDVEGYVPLALLCSYPNVGGYGAPLSNIIARLQETSATSRLEVDAANETVRLKKDWEQWLVPNQMGTMGHPRYIKQQFLMTSGVLIGDAKGDTEQQHGFVNDTGDAAATATDAGATSSGAPSDTASAPAVEK